MKQKPPKRVEVGFQRHFCQEHVSSEKITIEQIIDYLKDNEMRITKSRRTILEVLLDGKHSHTMSSLIRKAKKIDSKANTSSIYNNLYALAKINVVKATIDLITHEPTYELAVETVPHMHVLDTEDEVQHILDIDCRVHKALVDSFHDRGYILTDYLIQAKVRKVKSKK